MDCRVARRLPFLGLGLSLRGGGLQQSEARSSTGVGDGRGAEFHGRRVPTPRFRASCIRPRGDVGVSGVSPSLLASRHTPGRTGSRRLNLGLCREVGTGARRLAGDRTGERGAEATSLLQRWASSGTPPPIPGCHRIHLAAGRRKHGRFALNSSKRSDKGVVAQTQR